MKAEVIGNQSRKVIARSRFDKLKALSPSKGAPDSELITSSPPITDHSPPARPRVYQRNARNRTGCHGVCYSTVRIQRAHDAVTRHYFGVYAGRRNRRFCIETLGVKEAYRKAVKLRAEFEREAFAREGFAREAFQREAAALFIQAASKGAIQP